MADIANSAPSACASSSTPSEPAERSSRSRIHGIRVAKVPTTAPWTRNTPLIAARATRGDGTTETRWTGGAPMTAPAHDGKLRALHLEVHRPGRRAPVARRVGDEDRQLRPELLGVVA